MMPKARTYFNWSSGKDSALALYYLLQEGKVTIDRLLTTVNGHYNRVSMHGLRRSVLEAQAEAIDIPLDILEVPENPTMDAYNTLMEQKVLDLKSQGYTQTVFGDIFLEDLKKYREDILRPLGIQPIFPIWKKDTKELLHEFLDLGFKAVTVCINNSKLDKSFLGQELSMDFLNALPADVDPCGENGEFHTFCFDGPIFKHPVSFQLGEQKFRAYDNPSDSSKSIQFGFSDVFLIE